MIAYTNQKTYKKKTKKKKTDLQNKWTKIRQKMDCLVKDMETLNIQKIAYHEREIKKLCKQRNKNLKRKTKLYHGKKNRKIKDMFTKKEFQELHDRIERKRHWVNFAKIENDEEWLADSGASAYMTNSEEYIFNKVKDRSIIVVITGKETRAIARGEVIICHSKTGQIVRLKEVLLVPDFKQTIMSIL